MNVSAHRDVRLANSHGRSPSIRTVVFRDLGQSGVTLPFRGVPVAGLFPAFAQVSSAEDLEEDQIGCHIEARRTDSASAVLTVTFPESISHDFRVTVEGDPKTLPQHKEVVTAGPPGIVVPAGLLYRSVFFNREGRTTLSDGTGHRLGFFDNERMAIEEYSPGVTGSQRPLDLPHQRNRRTHWDRRRRLCKSAR